MSVVRGAGTVGGRAREYPGIFRIRPLRDGTILLAHRNVRDWIHIENLRMFGKDIKPHQKAFIEALLPPTVTYDESVDLYLRDSGTNFPRTHGR